MGVSLLSLSANNGSFKGSNGIPSFGCMIGDRCNSEYASSISSVDAPPSFTDFSREVGSRSSIDQNLDEVKFEEATSSSALDGYLNVQMTQFRSSFTNWQKGQLLGSGSMGHVYEGLSEHGYFIAVKEVSSLDQDAHRAAQLQQKISILSQFHHDNIVRYLGTDMDDGKLYIFLELVSKGSLEKLYQRYHLPDSHVSFYTKQILSGLNYLHERSVVHRDIKCANILVDASGSIKLADFGLVSKAQGFVVEQGNDGYGLAADIWSLGCTVLEMLTRKIPYSDLEVVCITSTLLSSYFSILTLYTNTHMQALLRIGNSEPPPIPKTLSAEAYDFVCKCLQANPQERPTTAQLLKHPFLTISTSTTQVLASPYNNIIQF
ncbi:hypothetical protein OSB04_022782 [Centaurea solstitialis]|uniref:mitogen-activated protein kinase kinase kinase n=1 Tax=Centaurea solstitialis TaxID=347529 RepID=A0AA38SHX5_9ASTR|nr:hypothetical protein OSB04_022782 [Centaurea solstitialis]